VGKFTEHKLGNFDECHHGREEFLARTKFKESNRYVVIDKGQRVDSKPLLAMAYQLQFRCGKNEVPRLSGDRRPGIS
jgi:hypothetical protein